MSSNKPFPSSDLDVFKENSLILDNFVNSQENEYPDRFARKRPTITGIIREAFNVRTDISNMNETLIGQSRWDVVPKNTSLTLGGDNGALNKQAQALFNRTVMLKAHAREALRRTYLEVGLNLVDGSFEAGGTVDVVADVLLYEATGVAYSWGGPFPYTVGKNSTPSSTGGVGPGAWVDRSDVTIRSELSGPGGAGLVGGAGQVINSIASLRTLSKTAPSKHAFVTAYRSSLPLVGGGLYCLDATDTTSADNGGTIIVASDGGRWKLVHGGEVSICQFGCVGDDSTDNSDAMDKCILAALAENFVVGIPSGVFRCTVTRNYTLPVKHLLRFRGAGSEVSTIDITTGGDGWVFTAPPPWSIGNLTSQSTGVHFSGITFCTDNAFVGNGITITSATNPAGVIRFTDVEFMPRAGRDSYWLRAVDIFGFGNTRFTRGKWVLGTALHAGTSAVRVRASSANQNAFVIFDHPQSIWGDKVFDIGDYIEGIYFTQPHAINCNIGIHHYPVNAESGLHIIGGHIAAAQYDVYMRNVVDFVIKGLLVYRTGTDPAWTGIYGQNVGRGAVSGNVVVCGGGAPLGTGIRISATQPIVELYGLDISGNTFSLVGDAVSLGSSTSNVNVGPNTYGTVANKVVNGAGTANTIDKLDYSGTVVVTLAGETSKDVSVNLPTQFKTKPLAGFMQSSGSSPILGSYRYDASSPSVAVFNIYKGDGSPLPSGNYRFSYIVHE